MTTANREYEALTTVEAIRRAQDAGLRVLIRKPRDTEWFVPTHEEIEAASILIARGYGFSAPAASVGDAPSDAVADVDLCEVARELERVHVADVICKVASLNGGRTTPYWCGFALACEEIAIRLGLPVDDVTRALEQEVP